MRFPDFRGSTPTQPKPLDLVNKAMANPPPATIPETKPGLARTLTPYNELGPGGGGYKEMIKQTSSPIEHAKNLSATLRGLF